ncbi:hypothetical protein J6590_031597 [Homalodisca vitripennis]|nr:hypothetical protein J6590_031597 [Homalodisca vitripennis]
MVVRLAIPPIEILAVVKLNYFVSFLFGRLIKSFEELFTDNEPGSFLFQLYRGIIPTLYPTLLSVHCRTADVPTLALLVRNMKKLPILHERQKRVCHKVTERTTWASPRDFVNAFVDELERVSKARVCVSSYKYRLVSVRPTGADW